MSRAHVRRFADLFLDSVIKSFKCWLDFGEITEAEVARYILEEAPGRLELFDEAGDVREQVSRVSRPASVSGLAERLTRVAADDPVESSSGSRVVLPSVLGPLVRTEGLEVRPDRTLRQDSDCHSSCQDCGCSRFSLQVAARLSLIARPESNTEVQSADSAADGQVGRCSHIRPSQDCQTFCPPVYRPSRLSGPSAARTGPYGRFQADPCVLDRSGRSRLLTGDSGRLRASRPQGLGGPPRRVGPFSPTDRTS